MLNKDDRDKIILDHINDIDGKIRSMEYDSYVSYKPTSYSDLYQAKSLALQALVNNK